MRTSPGVDKALIETAIAKSMQHAPNLQLPTHNAFEAAACGQLLPSEKFVGIWSHSAWEPNQLYITTHGIRFTVKAQPYFLAYSDLQSVLYPFDQSCNILKVTSNTYPGQAFLLSNEIYGVLTQCVFALPSQSRPAKLTGVWGTPSDWSERSFDEKWKIRVQQGVRVEQLEKEGRKFFPNGPLTT